MTTGRIFKIERDHYFVKVADTLIRATGRGVFRKRKIHPLVGDYVTIEEDGENDALITEVHPRRNALVRPPIANVDQAIVVFSAVEPDFSPHLLDRFLTGFSSYRIDPIICLTKIDLASEETLKEVRQQLAYYEKIGYKTFETSISDPFSFEKVQPYFEGKTTVLAGQSGVGKSTLLNSWAPELQIQTAEISEVLGRGRHTTRHVELHPLGGGLLGDTPGFSSLDFDNIEREELRLHFKEFVAVQDHCKFRGCLHLKEPKCAVKRGIEEETIAPHRYKHYNQFMEEITNRKPRYS